MKILLCYISGCTNRDDAYISLLPVGLCYLQATLIEAGFDAVLANFSAWREGEIAEQVKRINPDIVGISQWTHNRHASLKLARLVRRIHPRSVIVFGGGHATFCYRELLTPHAPLDAIVLGEGEETLREMVERIARGVEWRDTAGLARLHQEQIVVNPRRPPLGDLDGLPYPASYLDRSIGVDIPLQASFVITARGCPSACRFCSSPGFWGRRVSFRSPDNVVDEIIGLRDRFGLIYFSFRDDTFTADRRRAMEICRLLIERKAHILWNCQSRVTAVDEELLILMKRAGCECLQLGVESGSPRLLELLGKNITPQQIESAGTLIRKVGIHLSVYLISDIPGETDDDIAATTTLMRRIRPDDGYVSPLAFYPGTALFDEAVREGRVRPDVFETSPAQAIYACAKRGDNGKRLLASLQHSGSSGVFERHKELLGFCSTTNIMAGEWCRQAGKTERARREFVEITEKEPDHPWGWYLLAELYAEQGERQKAVRCFRRVLTLVPNHQPSRHALSGS